REIQPTRAAHILYEQSSTLLNVRKDIENAMSRFLKKQEGRLELGASTIPGEYLLPRTISQFHQKYPKIEVAVAIGDTRQILARTTSGEIELGFVGAEPHDPDLECWPFASDQLILAAPISERFPLGPITLTQLQQLPLVMREPGSGTRQAFEQQLEKAGLHLRSFNIIAELGSTTAIKEAVIHNLGLGILSDLAIEQEMRFKLLRTLTIKNLDLPRRTFYVVVNKRRQRSPLCELMLEHISKIGVMAEN
ncbi:MAG: LysR substrate-binding domain-containing protein, partial [Acidobacteriota bacterium]